VATKALAARSSGTLELWGDGSQLRSYLHVDDAVDRIITITTADRYDGPVNVGAAGPVTCREIAELCLDIVGADADIVTDPAEPMFALGAFHNNNLVGITHIIYHRSCWTSGDYCYLQDLFTAENARNKGVATTLIEAVYARAKADGASRVHWLTHETNATAQKLYEKVAARSGFIQYRKILSL